MRGETREIFVWFAIILVVLGVILFGVATKLGGEDGIIQGIQNFLPSFKDSEDVLHGKTIVGVQFGEDRLQYYDGSRWKVLVPKEDGKFHLEGKIFGNDIRDELINFYTNTERFGNGVFEDTSSKTLRVIDLKEYNKFKDRGKIWYYRADQGDEAQETTYYSNISKNKFEGYTFSETGIYTHIVDGEGNLFFFGMNDNFYLPQEKGFFDSGIQLEIVQKKGYQTAAISVVRVWRDQIAQGGKCEKFLELRYKDDKGNEEVNYYSVVRNGEFIYVDLDEPARGAEKYYNADCAGAE